MDEVDMRPTPVQTPRIPIVMGFWWPNKRPIQRGAEWDGIMPFAPSFLGKEGLHGEPVTGTPAEEARDIMDYYRTLTDELGEVVFPIDPEKAPPDFAETCADLGATWLLTLDLLEAEEYEQNLERLRSGPPKSGGDRHV